MTIKKLSLFLIALALPFALMSCSDDPTSVEEDDDPVELVYAISFAEGDGVATFFIDLTGVEGFNPDAHSVFITGSLIDWERPGDAPEQQQMVLIEGENTEIPVVTPNNVGDIEYKYFSDFIAEGWDGGEWDGEPNRAATLSAGAQINDVWGVQPE